MIKKYIVAGVAVSAIVFGSFYLYNTKSLRDLKEEKIKKKAQEKAEPGWYAQYFEMKKNEYGIIPQGVTNRIWEEEKAVAKMASPNLLNITEIGPDNIGGRTRALLVDKSNSNHLIAGGVSGGIWNSYNKGTTWTSVNDFSSSLAVTCLTQNPFMPAVVYYGTGEHTGNSTGIYGGGIFKSLDGGTSFTHLPASSTTAFTYIWSIKSSLVDSNTIYVGTASNGLYRSIDGGASFQSIINNSWTITDIEVFADSSVMLAVRGGGIYKSPNGNPGTFTKLTSGLPSTGFARIEVEKCEGSQQVIYAQFEKSTGGYYTGLLNMYKSINGGTTWTLISNAETAGVIFYGFSWYCFLLGVSPTNPNVVISGGVELGYSTDGGNTWNPAVDAHADNHIAVFDHQNTNKFYVGNDGGIHLYDITSASLSSVSLNNGYNVTQFYAGSYFNTGESLLAGAQDNNTLLTFNGSPVFNAVNGGDGSFAQINRQNNNISYVSSQYGRIRKATNTLGGTPTYALVLNELDQNADNSVDDDVWFINPFEMNKADGDQIYFTAKRRVWRTTNGANNWTQLTNTIGNVVTSTYAYAIGVSNAVNPTVYIGGANALLYRVDNAATAIPGSEVNLSASAPAAVATSFISNITVHPNYDSVIYVAFSNYSTASRVYRVTNAKGSTPVWTSMGDNLPSELPVNWIEVHPYFPDSFLIAATDFGLYVTTDGGTSWQKESTIPNVSIHQLRLRESDGKLFIFTHGRGIWTAQLPHIYASTNNIEEEKNIFAIYPNPVSDVMNIYSNTNENLNAVVYDLQGKMVQSFFMPASNTFQVDVSTLAKGTYFININGRETRKIIKF